MKDLIEALTIFVKYIDPNVHNPTNCDHDILRVCGVDPAKVTPADLERLKFLSFDVDDEFEHTFYSYRFGSC